MNRARSHVAFTAVTAVAYAMFFLMMALPFFYLEIKLPLLAFVSISIAVWVVMRRGVLPLHPTIGRWSIYYATLGLFFILLGTYRARDDAWFYVVPLYVVFPLIYTVLLLGASRVRILIGLQRTMVLAGAGIGTYTILYFLSHAGIVPQWTWLELDPLGVAYDQKGVVGVRMGSISTLVFLLPYLISKLIVREPRARVTIHPRWIWMAVIVCFPVGVLAGRKALLLVTVLAPFVTVGLIKLLPAVDRGVMKRQLLGFSMVLMLLVIGGGSLVQKTLFVNYQGVFQRVSDGLVISADTHDRGAYERWGQLHALLRGWSHHPLLGVGHGVALPDVVRAPEKPWRYELSYIALLYHTGIIGLLAYGAGIAWLIRTAMRVIRSGGWWGRSMIPHVVGLLSMVIAYATNPYFDTFDAIWTIFVPLAFVNVWMQEVASEPHPKLRHCAVGVGS